MAKYVCECKAWTKVTVIVDDGEDPEAHAEEEFVQRFEDAEVDMECDCEEVS